MRTLAPSLQKVPCTHGARDGQTFLGSKTISAARRDSRHGLVTAEVLPSDGNKRHDRLKTSYRRICCYTSMLMKHFISIVVLSVLLIAPLQANQEGIVVRTAAVHASPSHGAQRVGELTAGTTVSIFSRQGGWKEVFSEERSIIGWVRGYQVREGSAAPVVETTNESDSRGFLAGLASFSRKASSFFKSDSSATSSGTATIGVRGLSEDEIKTAQADFAEFERMKQFASNGKRAGSFARQGGLSSTRVPHISGKKQ